MWNEPVFPKICFGPAYFIAPESIQLLIGAHEKGEFPILPLEDVYVTGQFFYFLNIIEIDRQVRLKYPS